MSKDKKAKVVKVGDFDENGKPIRWVFDCGNAGCMDIGNLKTIFAGYTVDELKEIYAQSTQGTQARKK
jgi:hypothetical protein